MAAIFQALGVILFVLCFLITFAVIYWFSDEMNDWQKRTKYWDNWRNKNR